MLNRNQQAVLVLITIHHNYTLDQMLKLKHPALPLDFKSTVMTVYYNREPEFIKRAWEVAKLLMLKLDILTTIDYNINDVIDILDAFNKEENKNILEKHCGIINL